MNSVLLQYDFLEKQLTERNTSGDKFKLSRFQKSSRVDKSSHLERPEVNESIRKQMEELKLKLDSIDKGEQGCSL